MPATASKDARDPLSHLDSMRFRGAMSCPHLCLGRDSARPISGFVAAVAGRGSEAPGLFQIAEDAPRGPGLDKFSPAQIIPTGLMLARFANRHL
jgi:hypothetical protein